MQKMLGFTLLEIMTALSIFTITVTGSWKLLDQVSTTKKTIEKRSIYLSQLQKSLWLINRDITEIVDRPIKNENGDTEPPITSKIPDTILSFTRNGLKNYGQNSHSSLQRIEYKLIKNKHESYDFYRGYWQTVDRTPKTKKTSQLLIENISNFEIKFIDHNKSIYSYWPNKNQANSQEAKTIPTGIQLTFFLKDLGKIDQTISLRDTKSHNAQKN